MKLSYWYAPLLTDSNCMSIRKRRKKDVIAELAAMAPRERRRYGSVRKIVIEYADGFDLLSIAIDGVHEENVHLADCFLERDRDPC